MDRFDDVLKSSFVVAFVTAIVSCYFFPFEFTFLPEGLNTKMLLAAIGVLLFVFHCIRNSSINLNRELMVATLIVILYCLIGFISVDYNNTGDYTYAIYFISYAVWLGGAYTVCRLILFCHNKLTLKLQINYLALVCVVQCLLALAIDLIIPLKNWVDSYISQTTVADTDFLNDVNRLYGIGAALDVAGTRFSMALLGLSALLVHDHEIRNSRRLITIYFLAFLVICGVGNMISRTTSVGMALALVYLFGFSGMLSGTVNKYHTNLWVVLGVLGVFFIATMTYLYNNDPYYHSLMRYGFEGFFNWIEKGQWTTDSTEKLNNKMWLWPSSTKSWVIGDGSWAYIGTDIGYCRFIFYSGVIGLVLFSLFFIYNAIVCIHRFPSYKLLFIGIMLLGFIIWIKVPTDLFIIYALLYCINNEKETSA